MSALFNMMTVVGAIFIVLFILGGGLRMLGEFFRGGQPSSEGFGLLMTEGFMGFALLLGGEVMSVTIGGAPGVLGSMWNLIMKIVSVFAGAA